MKASLIFTHNKNPSVEGFVFTFGFSAGFTTALADRL